MASRRPYNPTLIDESKIKKEEPIAQTPVETPKVEQPIQQPIQEPVKPIEKPIEIPVVEEVKVELVENEAPPCEVKISSVEDNSKQYLDIISQFKDQEEEKVPVFNYSKDKSGKIQINPKNSKTEVINQPINNINELNDISLEVLQKVIDLAKENIEKTKIEIKVQVQLFREEQEQNRKKNLESKIELLRQDLSFQNKRLTILEKLNK